jgi:peptidyl-prolyl cis-trans isomerase SurA
MGAGDISGAVRTASGFHIVKVNDIRSANKRSEVPQMKIRHILITPNEIIDDATAQQKLRDAIKRINDGEDFGEVAKILSDDPGSANNGGDMGWTSPGIFVPEFEEIANNMEIGKISEPFKSRFGWHILEVTERRIYDNTEDLKEDRCAQQIRNSKVAEETDLWVRRLRDEAYVETRL